MADTAVWIYKMVSLLMYLLLDNLTHVCTIMTSVTTNTGHTDMQVSL